MDHPRMANAENIWHVCQTIFYAMQIIATRANYLARVDNEKTLVPHDKLLAKQGCKMFFFYLFVLACHINNKYIAQY